MPSKRTVEEILRQYAIDDRGCWVWTKARDRNGYGRFRRDGKTWRPHRVSYEFHVAKVPTGKCVFHKCGARRCINPAHLYVGAQQGERNGFAKLTDTMAASILKMHISGVTSRNMARLFRTCERTIRNVLKGRAWTHVRAVHEPAREMFLFSPGSGYGICERNARIYP